MQTSGYTNGCELVKNDSHSKRVNPTLYKSKVGSLLHAARATQPDIAHTIGIISKFNMKPTEAHLTVKKIFRYLKGTLDLVLQYRVTGESLLGYTNAE